MGFRADHHVQVTMRNGLKREGRRRKETLSHHPLTKF